LLFLQHRFADRVNLESTQPQISEEATNTLPFAIPGAGGPFFGDGTIPQSINPSGEITGLYTDAIGAYHGFVREHPHQED
jgi:hypothetical protein